MVSTEKTYPMRKKMVFEEKHKWRKYKNVYSDIGNDATHIVSIFYMCECGAICENPLILKRRKNGKPHPRD